MSENERLIALKRQWRILGILPAHPQEGFSVSKIQRELKEFDSKKEWSKRTIKRDLDMLSQVFPISHDDAATQLWSWHGQVPWEKAHMDEDDALSLCMLEGLLQPLFLVDRLEFLKGRIDKAHERLSANLSEFLKRYRYIEPSLDVSPPQVDIDIRKTIQQAILKNRQVDAVYCNRTDLRNGQPTVPRKRVLNPLGFVQRGLESYLVAQEQGQESIKIYALHRFTQVTLLDDLTETPEEFDFDLYLRSNMQFGSGQPIDLKARVSSAVALFLRERPFAPDQTLEQEGDAYVLRARVCDTYELRWWLVSRYVAVDEPLYLREELKAEILKYASYF